MGRRDWTIFRHDNGHTVVYPRDVAPRFDFDGWTRIEVVPEGASDLVDELKRLQELISETADEMASEGLGGWADELRRRLSGDDSIAVGRS